MATGRPAVDRRNGAGRQRYRSSFAGKKGNAMPRACGFCGGQDVSKEHLWPEWILKIVRQTRGGERKRFTVEHERHGKTARFRSAKLETKVGMPCEMCNKGWMSELENSVRPFPQVVSLRRLAHDSADRHGPGRPGQRLPRLTLFIGRFWNYRPFLADDGAGRRSCDGRCGAQSGGGAGGRISWSSTSHPHRSARA